MALLAYTMFSSSGGKGNGERRQHRRVHLARPASTGSQQRRERPPSPRAGVAIYDAADGTEGKGYGDRRHRRHLQGLVDQPATARPTATHNLKKKAGTGLVFDLGAAHQINDVSVTVGNAGGAMEMMVGDSAVTSRRPKSTGHAPDRVHQGGHRRTRRYHRRPEGRARR